AAGNRLVLSCYAHFARVSEVVYRSQANLIQPYQMLVTRADGSARRLQRSAIDNADKAGWYFGGNLGFQLTALALWRDRRSGIGRRSIDLHFVPGAIGGQAAIIEPVRVCCRKPDVQKIRVALAHRAPGGDRRRVRSILRVASQEQQPPAVDRQTQDGNQPNCDEGNDHNRLSGLGAVKVCAASL